MIKASFVKRVWTVPSNSARGDSSFRSCRLLERLERRRGTRDEGAEKRGLDPRLRAIASRERLLELAEDGAESAPHRLEDGSNRGFETLPRRFSRTRSLERVLAREDPEEAHALGERESRPGDRERGGDLLSPGKEREGVDERDPEELPGEDALDLGGEPPEDLEPPGDPALLLLKDAGNGVLAQAILLEEAPQERKLLPEARPAPGVIQAEPLELRLEPSPGLEDDPRRPDALGPERHVALEAIDEEEAAGFLGDDEREAGVDDLSASLGITELERDLLEQNLSHAHGSSFEAELGGIERTW
jgi:hypothetical protein